MGVAIEDELEAGQDKKRQARDGMASPRYPFSTRRFPSDGRHVQAPLRTSPSAKAQTQVLVMFAI
jgi:hypothetical protein